MGRGKSCPSFFLSPNESTAVLPPRYRAFANVNPGKDPVAFVADRRSGNFAVHFSRDHSVGFGVECAASWKFVAIWSQPENCTDSASPIVSVAPTIATA